MNRTFYFKTPRGSFRSRATACNKMAPITDLDGVDIDAIHVVSAGKGTAPVVPEPRAIAGDGGRK